MKSYHTLPITLVGQSTDQIREAIRNYFHRSQDLFESLFDLFDTDETFYLQSEPTRHPMIFYFGHTAVFFVNKLILAKVIENRIHPEFESMFAIGVDEMQWDEMRSSKYRWPGVDAVREYRKQVRQLVDSLIETLPLELPITKESPWWVILMGIEHERIHIETSSVLHRQMPLEKMARSEVFLNCTEVNAEWPANEMIAVAGNLMQLGKTPHHALYGWDNEYGHLDVDVKPFKAAKYLTSNGEFLEFVDAGGYKIPRYWSEEGWRFLEKREVVLPPFWVERDGSYLLRVLDREIDLPMNWPVEVSCLEAEAFCRFKSEKTKNNYRLPTEAEWYRMLETTDVVHEDVFDDRKANINFNHYASSVPVDTFGQGELYDVVGNVWQWTTTEIDGFEGFVPHPVYDDFSTPTFDGKHNVMKGGSWASTGNEITKHSRYAFRRHFYQHAGFRYIEADAIEVSDHENVYETDTLVSQYCEFQYGQEYFEVNNFARVCAEYAIEFTDHTAQNHALDLGCATGRATFELARVFDKVTGIDFSARFIQVGTTMQTHGRIRYERLEEGEIVTRQEQTLEELGLEDTALRVEFWQGDACNLKPHFKGYDLILATNLIDRLYEPKLFLDEVHQRLNDEGILILTSPYTWLEEYTEKSHWLGGYYDEDGHEIRTIDALHRTLEGHFEAVAHFDVPFVIRETARKFQHTMAQMSVWKKLNR